MVQRRLRLIEDPLDLLVTAKEDEMKKCVFSKSGSMIVPEVHDSLIQRIDFDPGLLSIYVKNPAGELNVLVFTGVIHFLCNGMAEQNLILDLWVDDREDAFSRVVAMLIQGESETQKSHRANMLEKLAKSELKLIQCSPSYGGEFALVCGDVSYQECILDVEEKGM